MPLALSADFLSRFGTFSTFSTFSTFNTFNTFNKPNTMNVRCAARTQPCAGRTARAGSR